MAGIPRPTSVAPRKRDPIMRTQTTTSRRPSTLRQSSIAPPSRSGAVSPTESVASIGMRRSQKTIDHTGPEETNIQVYVRCRVRNQREVEEKSATVLTTPGGVRGSSLTLTMNPSALSNKHYEFDRVFSPAAGQLMIFDDVVTPILNEMIAGFNCTIFAYGQTGTGKTYTMSGDMQDTLGVLPDGAGIIPRALYALFERLEPFGADATVKCSFIELYNEELKDLISPDKTNKLKIYDDTSKKSHITTQVQGMEETWIKTAIEGVELLKKGSHERQVAATDCNDHSSRSHTVFCVTARITRTGDNGEQYVSEGKLNLVDLAGSENIQRSGAENKRAAEAGLINKSLLTLGRVINALVDKSSHIPYRESKLTRLLQDSLGGQTKTCIIATVSPAKSNLEETISTLDYAFRAKNIRNKPQINQLLNKRTQLKEFTLEIERLKSELIATRQRNGVYLTNEAFQEMTTEAESMKVLNEEQSAQMETMETNLRNKTQELFAKITQLNGLTKEHENTLVFFSETKDVLDQTEIILNQTRNILADETMLRQAHQDTEEQLAEVGSKLITTLGQTVDDIGGLRAKIHRKSDLQDINRTEWSSAQVQVSDITTMLQETVRELESKHNELIANIEQRMKFFWQEELAKLSESQEFLNGNVKAFDASKQEVSQQTFSAKDGMDTVLEGIKDVRGTIETGVTGGFNVMRDLGNRIMDKISKELKEHTAFVHKSYGDLGNQAGTILDDLTRELKEQRAEANNLRLKINDASTKILQASEEANDDLDNALNDERTQFATDKETFFAQMTGMFNQMMDTQEARMTTRVNGVRTNIEAGHETFRAANISYNTGMRAWDRKEEAIFKKAEQGHIEIKRKLSSDYKASNENATTILAAVDSVGDEMLRTVDEQLENINHNIQAVDEFLTRAKTENSQQCDQNLKSLNTLSSTVTDSYNSIGEHFNSTFERVNSLGEDMSKQTATMEETLAPELAALHEPLSTLRAEINANNLREYVPTGETPAKRRYGIFTELPRTGPHDVLISRMRVDSAPEVISTTPVVSPVKIATIFHDDSPMGNTEHAVEHHDAAEDEVIPSTSSKPAHVPTLQLREVSANVSAASRNASGQSTGDINAKNPLKRPVSASGLKQPSKLSKRNTIVPLDGAENAVPDNFGSSVSTRKGRSATARN